MSGRPRDFGSFVSPAMVMFPDMERNEEIEHMARERYHVSRHLGPGQPRTGDLRRIAEEVDYPSSTAAPGSRRKNGAMVEPAAVPGRGRAAGTADRHVQEVDTASGKAEAGDDGAPWWTLGSATFNIQHLDRLIVLYYPPERDGDGQRPAIPGA